jgi:hypothetical protein
MQSGIVQDSKDSRAESALVESLVVAGDISRLGSEERAWYYKRRCEDLGIDVASKPFDVLRLNGKEVLYLNKSGTDQLARIHRVTRRIVEGPCLKVIEGTKLAYAKCEASTPDGRTEECVATIPWNDPAMALMKVETKAKRRATIAITGAGALDESEVDDIPAGERSAGRSVMLGDVSTNPRNAEVIPVVLGRIRDAIVEIGGEQPALTAEQAAAIWTDEYDDIVAGSLQERAGEMLELALGPKLKTRFKALLRDHEGKIAEAKREAHVRSTLEAEIQKIRSAATVGDLEAAKKALGPEKSAALAEYLWIRRVELSPSVGDLMRIVPHARESIKNTSMRERVLQAISKRQREIEGPPDDGGPDGGERAPASSSEADAEAAAEREAIASESDTSLPAAVERLRRTNGPKHAINHYLAHRHELGSSDQAAYREALVSWLPNRYPQAIRDREHAERELAEAEESSVRRAA